MYIEIRGTMKYTLRKIGNQKAIKRRILIIIPGNLSLEVGQEQNQDLHIARNKQLGQKC